MTLLGQTRWILWLLAAFIYFGCSSATQAPTPPPPSTTSSSLNDNDYNYDEDDEDEDEDDEDEDDEDEDEGDGSEFERGGAEVGDEEQQEAVAECLEEGRFYDRFSGDGECTRRKLANLDCTVEGITKHLSKKHKNQFEDALDSDSYKGYEIDQCVDCPPNSSSSVCKGGESGGSQVGTKVFFVKDGDTELLGKAILLPVRPGQEDGEDDE